MKFSIELYFNGLSEKYGNEFNLNIDEAAESLMYYNEFSNQYTDETMLKFLKEMKFGYVIKGSGFNEWKITKINYQLN